MKPIWWSACAAPAINDVFLPGFSLPGNVEPTADLREATDGAGIVLGVMPSRFARALYQAMLPHLHPEMQFVSATKGLEAGTLARMSEVARAGDRTEDLRRASPFSPARHSRARWRVESQQR